MQGVISHIHLGEKMSDSENQKYVEIAEGIKSIPIKQLEQCIANAISKEINGSKLDCHVTELKTSGISGVKLSIEVSNNHDDLEF